MKIIKLLGIAVVLFGVLIFSINKVIDIATAPKYAKDPHSMWIKVCNKEYIVGIYPTKEHCTAKAEALDNWYKDAEFFCVKDSGK